MKRVLSDHEDEEEDSDELPSCGYTLIEDFITPSHMLSSDIKRMQPQDMDKDRVMHCVRTNIDPESSYGLLVGKCVVWSWEHRPMFHMTTPCILYSKAHCEEYVWTCEEATRTRQLCFVALKEGTFLFRGKQRFDMNVGDLFVCDTNIQVTLPEMTTNHYMLVFSLNERK